MCEVNSLKDGAFNIAPGYSSLDDVRSRSSPTALR